MRIPQVLGGVVVAPALAVVLLVAGPGLAPAGASCVSPSLTVSPVVAAPGSVVTLSGSAFGTACNDTGGSRRVLGTPARDIEIVVQVRAGETLSERAVGRVDVGDDYDFVLLVQVPPGLGTGDAWVQARAGDVVLGSVTFTVAGPIADAEAWPYFTHDAPERGGRSPWVWLLLGVGTGAVIVLGVVAATGRRSRAPLQ